MLVYIIITCMIIPLFESEKIELCQKNCSYPMSLNCSILNTEELGRCCVNKGKTESSVVGLDLSSCHITSIEDMFISFNNLKFLYLQNNSIQVPTIEAFHGLTQLQTLKLPPKIDCPGGSELWNETKHTEDAVICTGELSSCTVYNVTCPNVNSYCVDVGPQVTECLCKPGYHGYKCLRQGTFPTMTFVIGLGVSTVVISGLLWVTQRRKAKKQV
ncbi:all-trans retinoic acid-induced differentiation factor-like [Mytilus galloprovincialis]|uniref:all-trans retinoic acid-induced differentiation factor-like n=1 Tax=Mytilus galloprovincialis TaxID=29158 RepID=UPI003F7BF208